MTNSTEQISQWIHSPKAPKTIAAILMIVILYIIVSSVHFWHSNTVTTTLPSDTTTSIKPISLADLHLFGRYSESISNLPLTSLPLVLKGTEASTTDDQTGSALIASQGSNKTKAYSVGQTVPGNAVIKRILKQSVVLDNNGHLEQLRMIIPTLPNEIEDNN